MSDQLAEEKNNVKIQQMTISELKECLRKKDSENEHLKSKIVDFTMVQNLRAQVKELQSENKHLKSKFIDCTMCQNLQMQVEELKSVNESLNLLFEELSRARALVEATLRERDELISDHLSSSVQKEYNDLLASNDVLKQRLETKFKFLKHDNSLEKMIETIEKEMGDKVKCFDEEKKAFETKISKLEKILEQRVKDFDDAKTELSKRTDKFETYFANLEKQNALLKSQLASQNYTSWQKENNDLRTSYNVLKEKHETSCEKLEKENNDLKMHYKRLFDSIKQKMLFLKYQVEGYTDEIVQDFEQRLDMIFSRQVNRVHVLDFVGMTGEMRQTLVDRMRMVYTWAKGQELISDTELGLDEADTLWPTPSYGYIRDPVRRMCHRLISYSISGRGHAPEKVTATDLFTEEHDQDENVPIPVSSSTCFRHAKRREEWSQDVLKDTLFGVLLSTLRQSDVAAGALEGAEGDPDVVERLCGVVDRSITDQSRFATWMISCMTQLMDASGRTYQAFDRTLVGSSQMPYQRRTKHRTGDASTPAAPQQSDP
ncbi:hypothetical protein Tco_0413815 [Tanacetum coccineum]